MTQLLLSDKMRKGNCKDCKHWTKMGEQDSGILARGSTIENWFYDVGLCSAPLELGNGSGGTWASWQSCYSFKRRRGAKVQTNLQDVTKTAEEVGQ